MSFCLANLEEKKIGLGKKLHPPPPIFLSFPFHSNQTKKKKKKSHFSRISQSNIKNKVCVSQNKKLKLEKERKNKGLEGEKA